MSYFLITDFAGDSTGVENSLAYRVKEVETLNTNIEAAIAANIARVGAIDDTTGIGSILRVAEQVQGANLASIEKTGVNAIMQNINNAFSSPSTSPVDDDGVPYPSFDAWYTDKKETQTEPLLTNEFTRVYRSMFGDGALTNTNCAVATDTVYAAVSQVGNPTGTSITYTVYPSVVDPVLYAGAPLYINVTTTVVGGSAQPVTGIVNGITNNGSAWVGTFSITSGSTPGTDVVITPAIAKTYPTAVLTMTVANAVSGAFDVLAGSPRTLAQ